MHQSQLVRPFAITRVVRASIVAAILAVTLTAAVGWHPFCVLYDTWDAMYWILGCWDGPPPPSGGG